MPALLFLGWAIPFAWLFNPTVDEMYSLQTASQGPGYAASQAISFELQAPAYFVFLSIWTKAFPGLIGARGFSICCLFLALLLLPGLSKRYLPQVWAGYLPILFATNPFVLHLAVDARSYALLTLLTIVVLRFQVDAYQYEQNQLRNRIGLALATALGLATHYYVGLFLAVLGGSWLVQKQWRHFLRFSLDMTPALVILAWLGPALQEQYLGHTGYHPAGDGTPLFLWAAKQGEALLLQAHHFGEIPWLPALLRTTGVLCLAYLIWNGRGLIKAQFFSMPLRQISLLVLGMSMLYLGIGAIMGLHFLLLNKWFPFVVPLLLLWVGVLSVDTRFLKVGVYTLAASTLLGSAWHAMGKVKTYDYRQVVADIEAFEHPQEPILIYPNYEKLPLEYVYQGKNELVPVLGEIDFNGSWGIPPNHVKAETEWTLPNEVAADSVGCIWLVSWLEESNLGVPFANETLVKKIDCQFLVIEEWTVGELIQVQRWKRKREP